ncbi:gamma-glutamyltransferase [Reticulomyxa filosa]|uniref:Gamma-glutamyltransferase n=1 Tax=Reticulomyxa filosa TaxID=46433 RepID=X6M5Q7_RETFI|nr:gamma-glutamyltransferase [Reticulomyxa filosa]|eukprot:ETO08802.1 gamma-glutamyltransferase [Reticulomyxa filosa]
MQTDIKKLVRKKKKKRRKIDKQLKRKKMSIYFQSRRSPVLSRYGMVASSQHLVSQVGQQILKSGGNAVDACVAMNAVLGVVEPTSTGLGGDCFVLFYDNSKKKVFGLNGSGRTSQSLTHEYVKQQLNSKKVNIFHALNVTVPGNVCGMLDLFTSIYNPYLAKMLRNIISHGKDGFYSGDVADALVSVVQEHKGLLTLKDLAKHTSTWVDPINVNYKGINIWEIPPNGQGIAALMALNFYQHLQTQGKHTLPPFKKPESIADNFYGLSEITDANVQDLHYKIECMRLGFKYAREFRKEKKKKLLKFIFVFEQLSKKIKNKKIDKKGNKLLVGLFFKKLEFAKERGKKERFSGRINNKLSEEGKPLTSSDIVSFCAVDYWGNACSFISSNFHEFGTGLVPKNFGFTLQNQDFGDHITRLSQEWPHELFADFGVMGGFMQPQGHFQVLTNLIDKGMNAQECLDEPMFCISLSEVNLKVHNHSQLLIEENIYGNQNIQKLCQQVFGRGQVIFKNDTNNVLWGGSDGHGDGCALGLECPPLTVSESKLLDYYLFYFIFFAVNDNNYHFKNKNEIKGKNK